MLKQNLVTKDHQQRDQSHAAGSGNRNLIKSLVLQSHLEATEEDSPVLLRKFLRDQHLSKSKSVRKKSVSGINNNETSSSTVKKQQSLEIFHSLESNLDQGCTSSSSSRPVMTSSMGDSKLPHLSSLPSMTSGRFYSANSSIFSGVSSPRSDMSPSKDSDTPKHEDTDKNNRHYIEPIVEIVDSADGCDTFSNFSSDIRNSIEEQEDKLKENLTKNSNRKSPENQQRKTIITSLDLNANSSVLKKSLSLSSPYQSLTKVCVSEDELPLEHTSLKTSRKNSVKFEQQRSCDSHKAPRKYQTLPPQLQRLSSSRGHKLGLKYLGSRTEELSDAAPVTQHFYEEGELSGWSTRDIYDIVSKDLPSMDIIILVISQEEKKMIDRILSRNTGVIGYMREYWSGFFPLLLVEVANKDGDTDLIENKSVLAIHSLFSVTHRIIINNYQHFSDFIFESVARFYNHIKVYQCEKFYQSLHTQRIGHLVSLSLTERFWFCNGLCRMRVSKPRDVTDDDATNTKPVQGFMQSVRKTIRSRIQSEVVEGGSGDDKLEETVVTK